MGRPDVAGNRPAELYAHVYGGLSSWWEQGVRRRPVARLAAELECTQWLAAESIERLQVQALQAVLRHAGERVPYWRDLFRRLRFDPRSVRRRADLEQLPLLTREIVRERAADLVDPGRGRTIVRHTSGTTGAPLRFEVGGLGETWRDAARLRGYAWAGFRPGVPALHYAADGPGDVPPGLRGATARLGRALRREVHADAVGRGGAALERAALLVERGRPRVIPARPQLLARLARWIDERRRRTWPGVPVVCVAEAVLGDDRAAIERAFGPVFETYVTREAALVAAECEAHAGMHLCEESVLVEVVRDGRALPPGGTGDVVVTDLHETAMPFIRYVAGDVATLAAPGPCACGRALRRLARVDGRRTDTLRDARGEAIPGVVVAGLMRGIEGVVRRYQLVQRRSGEATLRVVPGPRWSPQLFAPIAARFEARLAGLPFHVVTVDDIAPARSGELRPVVVE